MWILNSIRGFFLYTNKHYKPHLRGVRYDYKQNITMSYIICYILRYEYYFFFLVVNILILATTRYSIAEVAIVRWV